MHLLRLCGGQWCREARYQDRSQFSHPSDKEANPSVPRPHRILSENYAIPLTDLTKKSLPDSVKWSSECEAAFVILKKALCGAPVLSNPNFGREFILQTDASDRGVGAVLSQVGEDKLERPVAYFSRKLLPREVKYSTIEKECLAIKLGVEAFRVYLLGRNFVIQTDHRSLVWLDKLKDRT